MLSTQAPVIAEQEVAAHYRRFRNEFVAWSHAAKALRRRRGGEELQCRCRGCKGCSGRLYLLSGQRKHEGMGPRSLMTLYI